MIHRLDFFTHILVPHWAAANPCGHCGVAIRRITVRKILFFRQDAERVLLSIPHKCSCGGNGCIKVGMPALVFGFLLLRAVQFDFETKQRRQQIEIYARSSDDIVDALKQEFDEIAHLTGTAAGRSANRPIHDSEVEEFLRILDATDFSPNSESWKEFLRRLGADSNPEADSDESSPA